MQQMSIEQALQAALQHHQAGRLNEAEAIYRQVLAADPNNADALHLLAHLASQVQRQDVAEQLIDRAIAVNPNVANYHNSRAMLLQKRNRLADAMASVRRALEIDPNLPHAHLTMGTLLAATGNSQSAIESYQRAIRLLPDYAEAYNNLGTAYLRLNDVPSAIKAFETALRQNPLLADAHYNAAVAYVLAKEFKKAIAANRESLRLRPNNVEALNNLGNLLSEHGDPQEALQVMLNAVQVAPQSHALHSNLANALLHLGQIDRAIEHLEKAVRLKPDFVDGYSNLGNAYQRKGDTDQTIRWYEKALSLQPDHLTSTNNLGSAYKSRGEIEKAIEAYRRGAALRPNDASLHDNVLLTMHYQSGMTPQTLLSEHRRWNDLHARPFLAAIESHLNDPTPDRTLRIGYLSADLKTNVIARFLMPLLERRDPAAVQNICFADVARPDAMTEEVRSKSDDWHDVSGMEDDQIAAKIRQERIDILVDLSLHAANNHMMVFARKPAPVQVTYLSYCSTSGMDQMDFRITDPWLDPPGTDLTLYTEQTVYLPETYWCYQDPMAKVTKGPLPADGNGHVTFGSLNNFCKVTPPTLQAWAAIVSAVPDSRILIHTLPGSHRDRIRGVFAAAGVDAPRIEFIDYLKTQAYFQTYNRIDIALDSFPYNGGTTTCDALWMGVPVVTLAGEIPVARAGVSLLSNVGLPELIGRSIEQYIQIATDLAADRERLRQLRTGLRDRMLKSPLMDAQRFTRHMEHAYRHMWHKWCEKTAALPSGASGNAG